MRAHRVRLVSRWIGGAALALGLAGCATGPLRARGAGAVGVSAETSSFRSRGHTIRVDMYKPLSAGRHPAAILLHGSSGIHAILSSPVNRYGETLAGDGVVALVVHYFDATGDLTASDEEEVRKYFQWVDVIRDAVTWARGLADVEPNRVGLVGHSLGAWLAVGAAAYDSRIDRIVLFGGGLEPFLEGRIDRMPPALMFHGDEDDVVPLSDATHLADFLRSHDWPVEVRVYRGEGHTLSDSAATDALARAARFLGAKATRPAAVVTPALPDPAGHDPAPK